MRASDTSALARLNDLRWYLSQTKARARGQTYFSINGLDRELQKVLDFDRGTFVEAGANDGATQSNTLYFERHRGWRGLLVEPMPALARRCRLIRRAIVENCALSSFEDRGRVLNMTYCNLMSIARDALPSGEEHDLHVRSGAAVQHLRPFTLQVKCVPLSDLLDKHGIKNIDLLSLDVEGYEPNALRGIDFSRHRPRFMLIEADRYRAVVEDIIGGHYRLHAELSPSDVLYRAL
jgi:FkbM family methyltransferase